MVTEDLITKVEPLVLACLREAEVQLVDVELVGARRRPTLRVVVDRVGGLTVKECAHFSRLIEAELDRAGLISGRYTLEVSSPGLERALRKKREFQHFVGREILVEVRRGPALHQYRGTLVAVEEREGGAGFAIRLQVAEQDEPLRLPQDAIASARLHVNWTDELRALKGSGGA